MQHKTFGKIAVPTPGTPVRVTNDENLRVHSLTFTQIPGSLGKTLIKDATGTVFLEILPAGTTGESKSHCFGSNGGNGVQPSDFYVDATIANEGLHVSYAIS